MIIAIAGYRGFIGRHLQKEFASHELILLDRKDLYGDPGQLSEKIQNADVVLNVAGFSVSKRWTPRNRIKIMESRVRLTQNLVEAMNLMKKKPACFINSSAIGVYEYDLTHTEEEYTYGTGFLVDVVKKWEDAARGVSDETKLILMRIGLVLGNDGGALPRLFRLFNLGLGGIIGKGKQVYSFIHIKDLCAAIAFLIEKKSSGVYNFTSPEPVTNKVFTKTIARELKRPAFIPIPLFAMRMVMGKASVIVTKGQTVYPKRLEDDGYKFTFASINDAIHNLVSQQ
jgi:hypothetical protein